MKVPTWLPAVLLGLAACASRSQHLTMPEHSLAARAPVAKPTVSPIKPQLVRYPGLEVAYVANADGETYYLRGQYYIFFDGEWFFASKLRGPWTFIEMKYVPSDLFRVRGHLPPDLHRGEAQPISLAAVR